MRAFLLVFILVLVSGCASIRLHEQKKSSSNPADLGTQTDLELKGPRAKVSHKF